MTGSGGDDVQIYDLDFTVYNLYDPFLALNPIDFDTTNIDQPDTITTELVNPSPTRGILPG